MRYSQVFHGFAGFEALGPGGDSGKLRQWMLFCWHPNKPANTDIELMLLWGVLSLLVGGL